MKERSSFFKMSVKKSVVLLGASQGSPTVVIHLVEELFGGGLERRILSVQL